MLCKWSLAKAIARFSLATNAAKSRLGADRAQLKGLDLAK